MPSTPQRPTGESFSRWEHKRESVSSRLPTAPPRQPRRRSTSVRAPTCSPHDSPPASTKLDRLPATTRSERLSTTVVDYHLTGLFVVRGRPLSGDRQGHPD